MKVLVDMNLSPRWAEVLAASGWDVVHGSAVGDPRASDRTILDWARVHGFVLLTHDLDFGSILAATQGQSPSVVQVRAQDVLPERMGALVSETLRIHESVLDQGALVSVDAATSRARILPLRR